MGQSIGKIVDIDGRKLKIKALLGEGGFAYVFSVKDVHTKQYFALKRVYTSDREALETARREICFLEACSSHANIVTLYHSCERRAKGGGTEILLLMDYCSGGNVVEIMNGLGYETLSESKIRKIFGDVLAAVSYLHGHSPPIAHRDLKLENILYETSTETYKLCDFNSATTKEIRTAGASNSDIMRWEEELDKHTTPSYRAPEMVDLHRGKAITHMADVWALGCLLYMLCFRRHPFETGSKLEILSAKIEFPKSTELSKELLELISCMLVVDPDRRPPVAEVERMFRNSRYNQEEENQSAELTSLDRYHEAVKGPYLEHSISSSGTRDNSMSKRTQSARDHTSTRQDFEASFADFSQFGTSASEGAQTRGNRALSREKEERERRPSTVEAFFRRRPSDGGQQFKEHNFLEELSSPSQNNDTGHNQMQSVGLSSRHNANASSNIDLLFQANSTPTAAPGHKKAASVDCGQSPLQDFDDLFGPVIARGEPAQPAMGGGPSFPMGAQTQRMGPQGGAMMQGYGGTTMRPTSQWMPSTPQPQRTMGYGGPSMGAYGVNYGQAAGSSFASPVLQQQPARNAYSDRITSRTQQVFPMAGQASAGLSIDFQANNFRWSGGFEQQHSRVQSGEGFFGDGGFNSNRAAQSPKGNIGFGDNFMM